MSDTPTPMMAQYRRVRAGLPPDTILFFRLGDFYEMFFDDAVTAAPILDIALTHRQHVPMCGVPYHAAEAHMARLIRAGKKVAVCDQLEDPATAKGIVRRDVTRIVTPGTVIEEGGLDARVSNYLAGLCRRGEAYGLAMLELSTGAFWVEEPAGEGAVRDLLGKFSPSEIVVPAGQRAALPLPQTPGAEAMVTPLDDWRFDLDTARDVLQRHFSVLSLDGFGCGDLPAGTAAAGAALHYVTQDLRRAAGHIRRLQTRRASEFMLLDESTVANLELVASRSGRGGAGPCLLATLDATRESGHGQVTTPVPRAARRRVVAGGERGHRP